MHNLKLLYVEDDLEALEDTSFLLKDFFSDVLTAQDGQEALEMYTKLNPDILVLDINLPKIDGIELASIIRETNSDIPILFITAFSDKELLLKAIDISASGYLVKPYKIDELKESVEKIVTQNFQKEFVTLEGGFIWNSADSVLSFQNQHINLTQNEISLLRLLVQNKTQFFKPSDIVLELAPSSETVKENNVVQLVSRFRNKINHDFNIEKFFIESVYGVGYHILIKKTTL